MDHAPFTAVARIVRAHGLTGEVSVAPVTRPPFLLQAGDRVWLVPPPEGVRDGTVESVRPGPKGDLVKIAGIDGIEAARSVRGCLIMLPTTELPDEILAGRFDAVGLAITDVERGYLGRVTEVIETGANDVWCVRDAAGRDVLLPVIDDVVLEIDEAEMTASVRLLDGLLDDTED